jgi:hypothetical protein
MTDSVKWAVRALRKRAREPSAGADATEELDIEVRVSLKNFPAEREELSFGNLKVLRFG